MADPVLRFRIDGRSFALDAVPPTTTLLEWLRANGFTGTKEGCAEGDCGACTVAIADPVSHDAGAKGAWRAVNSCLVFLPMLQGREIVTVQGLKRDEAHPAQEALVRELGSQCGYCTPGVVMSMFEAVYRTDLDSPERAARLDDQMCGNLCRCTGYRPIRQATEQVAGTCPADRFRAALAEASGPGAVALEGGQRYFAPGSVDELFPILAENPDHRLVCGGTDLALEVTKRRRHLPCVVSVEAIPELRRFEPIPGGYRIGATMLLSDLEAATREALPPVARMLRFFASRQIKNRGTIGDLPPVLLALDATCVLRSGAGERRVSIDDFFLGYRQTALRPGEILAAIEVPTVPDDARVGVYKVSRRRELDISAVCAGLLVKLDGDRVREARLAYGGMAATPKRAARAEAALVGKPWTEASVTSAMEALAEDFQPLDDHRGSAWYRLTVARNLLLGFYHETGSAPFVPLSERPTATVEVT